MRLSIRLQTAAADAIQNRDDRAMQRCFAKPDISCLPVAVNLTAIRVGKIKKTNF